MIIASHIILTGYGHWLPNDPRGSMSQGIREDSIRPLGPVHHGRKDPFPDRSEIREFYRDARDRVKHPILWFEAPHRDCIGRAIGELIRAERFTCYACAVLADHVHLLFRRHRVRPNEMLVMLRDCTRKCLEEQQLFPDEHPVWSLDVNIRHRDTPQGVRSTIDYIWRNFEKHRIPPQHWEFVVPYDDWPFHKHKR